MPSATLSIRDTQNAINIMQLLKTTVDIEINRLEIAIQFARQKLANYETKYQVSSNHFITTMVAEDLIGGDDEYVTWAGELKLCQKLLDKQETLRNIQYVIG